MTGFRLNLNKLNFFGVGVEDQKCQKLAVVTGCSATSFLFMYLGIPIRDNMNRIADWRVIVDKWWLVGW